MKNRILPYGRRCINKELSGGNHYCAAECLNCTEIVFVSQPFCKAHKEILGEELSRQAWLEWTRAKRTRTPFDEDLRKRITNILLASASEEQRKAWRIKVEKLRQAQLAEERKDSRERETKKT